MRTHIQLPGLHWRLVTMEPASDPGLAPFTESLDVMGDGSLVLLPTPGCTAGSVSLLVRRGARPPLLRAGDLTYGAETMPTPRGVPLVVTAWGGREDGGMAARMAGTHTGRPVPRRWARGQASAAAVAGSLVAGWVAGGVARRLSVRTGVCDEEAFGSLPGDEFIAHPMVEWTRGVSVRARPGRVWPWLAQMGYGRGGWYTPQWVDLFANRWVFGVKHPFPASASRLLPEYQQVAVGDLICDGPGYASYFRVLRVDPGRAVVYRSIRHPRRGSPIDVTDPASSQRSEQQLRAAGTYIDFTWALVLTELPGHRTRLLVRTRAKYAPPAIKVLSLPLGLFDATYGVAMLRAIARRAEGATPAGT